MRSSVKPLAGPGATPIVRVIPCSRRSAIAFQTTSDE